MRCLPCCRRYFHLRSALQRFFGIKSDCREIEAQAPNADRVQAIDRRAPNCRCESFQLNLDSAGPLCAGESVERFIFGMIHIDKTSGKVLPSYLDHAFNKGLSVQRSDIADAQELASFVGGFMARINKENAWLGTAKASVSALRQLVDRDGNRLFGIYDTPPDVAGNHCHAEVCGTRFATRDQFAMPDADRLAAIRALEKCFSPDGKFLSRERCKHGSVWTALPEDLRARKVNKKIDEKAFL